jgi:N-acetylneuraminate synthase
LNNFFEIDSRKIGKDFPPVVVVELGINHGGSFQDAIKLADLAIDAGAEVIKHQTHIPDAEMSREALQVKPGNADVSIYEVIKKNSISLDEERLLARHVRKRGVTYLSTPFSFEAVDFLDELGVPAYKIGSGECSNYPLVAYIAKKGKPIILSTGMNSIETIRPSVEIIRKQEIPFALLHCTNLYPTPDRLVRLNAILDLEKAFPDAVLGLSDHSLTNYPCLGAVGLGASILERHFTDNKNRPGPDISCSMTPKELVELIDGSHTIHSALKGAKMPAAEEEVTINFAFSSVVAKSEIRKGDLLSSANLTLKRPSGGDFGPRDFEKLFGLTARSDVPANTQLKREQIN